MRKRFHRAVQVIGYPLLMVLCVTGSCAIAADKPIAAKKPNVLLIVLDDAGYSDVAGFGRNDAPTPHLQALAKEGVRFTRHYADSTCRPARLALMTGRESARVAQNPDFRGISPEIITLPEALKAAGYSTHHVGKWHLGDSVRDAWPDRQGFDSWFGFLNQFRLKGPDKEGHFTKRPTYLNPFLQGSSDAFQSYPGHLEDILAERVSDKIRALADDQKTPWFINYWTFAPHHPSVAAGDFLKRFPDTPEGKYRALLAQVDGSVGRVINTLRDTRQLDNTLIIVTSDNGGTNQMMNNNDPFAGIKAGFEEGSLRTPLIIRWPDKRHAGETRDAIVAIQDIYPTVLAAAGTSSAVALDGQDLHPLLDGKALQPRMLIHEILSPGNFNFSLLSEDGAWRVTPDALFDLRASPAGDHNIAAQSPAIHETFLQHYQQWRAQKIMVSLHAATKHTEDNTQLTGDSFRRAPGYGALSIAVGVQWPLPSPVTLLSQTGIWALTVEKDHRVRLVIGNDSVVSDPVLSGHAKQEACVPVVMTSYFSRSRLHEGKNTGRMRLFVDNRKILEKVIENPEEPQADLAEPTRVGTALKVGTPLFFNADLPAASDHIVGEYTVEQAGAAACSSWAQLSGSNR